MATVHEPVSMNQANPRDPYNNSCYGTLVDRDYKTISLPILDVTDFNERIIRGYEEGDADDGLPADLSTARSLVPAGTAALRDFSNIAPEIPIYIAENCTGCMECVTECPDTAILGKVLAEPTLEEKLRDIPDEADRDDVPPAVVEASQVPRRGGETGQARRPVRHHHRPQQMQGVRRMRDRLRRRGAEDGAEDRAGDGGHPQEPSLVQGVRAVGRVVHQR